MILYWEPSVDVKIVSWHAGWIASTNSMILPSSLFPYPIK